MQRTLDAEHHATIGLTTNGDHDRSQLTGLQQRFERRPVVFLSGELLECDRDFRFDRWRRLLRSVPPGTSKGLGASTAVGCPPEIGR
jgi:hypothetical protein